MHQDAAQLPTHNYIEEYQLGELTLRADELVHFALAEEDPDGDDAAAAGGGGAASPIIPTIGASFGENLLKIINLTTLTQDAAPKKDAAPKQGICQYRHDPGNAEHLGTLFVTFQTQWEAYRNSPEDNPPETLINVTNDFITAWKTQVDFTTKQIIFVLDTPFLTETGLKHPKFQAIQDHITTSLGAAEGAISFYAKEKDHAALMQLWTLESTRPDLTAIFRKKAKHEKANNEATVFACGRFVAFRDKSTSEYRVAEPQEGTRAAQNYPLNCVLAKFLDTHSPEHQRLFSHVRIKLHKLTELGHIKLIITEPDLSNPGINVITDNGHVVTVSWSRATIDTIRQLPSPAAILTALLADDHLVIQEADALKAQDFIDAASTYRDDITFPLEAHVKALKKALSAPQQQIEALNEALESLRAFCNSIPLRKRKPYWKNAILPFAEIEELVESGKSAIKAMRNQQAEQARIAAEQAEKERIAAEQAEEERIAAEKAEEERIAAEKAEQERVAAAATKIQAHIRARGPQKQLTAHKAQKAAEQAAAAKAEQDRIAAEKAEQDRIAAEKAEEERIAAEQAEQDRIAAEKAEEERIAAEKAEEERIAAEKAEKERIAAEKAEEERIAAEKAEQDRIAAEKAEEERIAAEKAEEERLAAEQAAKIQAALTASPVVDRAPTAAAAAPAASTDEQIPPPLPTRDPSGTTEAEEDPEKQRLITALREAHLALNASSNPSLKDYREYTTARENLCGHCRVSPSPEGITHRHETLALADVSADSDERLMNAYKALFQAESHRLRHSSASSEQNQPETPTAAAAAAAAAAADPTTIKRAASKPLPSALPEKAKALTPLGKGARAMWSIASICLIGGMLSAAPMINNMAAPLSHSLAAAFQASPTFAMLASALLIGTVIALAAGAFFQSADKKTLGFSEKGVFTRCRRNTAMMSDVTTTAS